MNNPLVSVCMITYRHAPFIIEAINGVLMQKANFEIELIIADDFSDDDTCQIINALLQHRNGVAIRYTRHASNKGVVENFRWAVNQCRGKYIAFCEGDDYWTDPLKLQKQIALLENELSHTMSFHHRFLVDDAGNRVKDDLSRGYAKRTLSGVDMIRGKYPPTLTLVIRRELFDNFPWPQEHVVNLDSYVVSILGQYGSAYFHADILPAAYRIHSGGVWSQKNRFYKMVNVYQTFEAIKRNLLPRNRRLVISKLGRLSYDISKELLEQKSKVFYKYYFVLLRYSLSKPALVLNVIKLSMHFMLRFFRGARPV